MSTLPDPAAFNSEYSGNAQAEKDQAADEPTDAKQITAQPEDAGNESEAETEILNGSKSNTPRKPLGSQQLASSDMYRASEMDGENDEMAPSHQSRGGVKRKARPSDLTQPRRNYPGSSRSPTKKARLSPEYKVTPKSSSSESEYEPELDIKSSMSRSRRPRSGASPDKHDETYGRETRGNRQNPSEWAPPSALMQSYRASSHEIRPRSTSPGSLHKRSTSFQSPLFSADPHHLNRHSRRSHPPLEHASTTGTSLSSDPDRRTRSTLHQSQSLDYDIPASLMAKSQFDRFGRTRLAQACYDVAPEAALQILEDHPEMIETPDNNGTRPLHFAASYGLTEVVESLLEKDCELDCRNQESETPLFNAIQSSQFEVAQLLLKKGANPWMKDWYYSMPRDLLLNAKIPEEQRIDLEKALLDAATLRLEQRRPKSRELHLPELAAPIKDQMNLDYSSVKTMEKACLVGNKTEFDLTLSVRTRPNFTCALKAAMGGHKYMLQRCLESENYRKSINRTPAQEMLELMKTAIGRGNLEAVEYILSREALDAEAQIDGLKLYDVSRSKKGPLMYKEIKLLKQAYNSSRRGAGATGDVSELESESHESEPEASENVEEEKMVDVEAKMRGGFQDSEGDEEMCEAKEETVPSTPSGPEPPHTLRWAMTPPHYPTGNENVLTRDFHDRIWRRSLGLLPKCHILKRSDIEGPKLSGPPDVEFTLNIYAPMYLRHTSLSQCRDKSGMSTLPMNEEMREWLLTTTLPQALVQDNHWEQASEPYLKNQPCPHAYRISFNGYPIIKYDYDIGRNWIQQAKSDQLFWISWADFCTEYKGCKWTELHPVSGRRETLTTFSREKPWECVFGENGMSLKTLKANGVTV